MDHRVDPVAPGWEQTFAVPPSKSVHQRALALAALADGELPIRPAAGTRPPGEDVRRCAEAFARLGRWQDGALGVSRTSLALDLGESGTAFRFAIALAALRPAGSRTLVRARPVLLRRPHGPLVRALRALGARVKRRRSGAVRVLGGGIRPGATVHVDMRRSSQFASALALVAPRVGGLTLVLDGGATSRAYLDLTLALLRDVGIAVDAAPERVTIDAGAPRAAAMVVPGDASAAACWWTAAVVARGLARVDGLRRDGRQADLAVLPILEAHGGRVVEDEAGIRVDGRNGPAPGDRVHDLTGSPDLMFLVGALAAVTAGTTTITGVGHARGKESDRIAVLVAGLRALGVGVHVDAADAIRIEGGGAVGGRVDAAGDHRAVFGFGVLGLAAPGVSIVGAEAASKSQPAFLADLASVGRGSSET